MEKHPFFRVAIAGLGKYCMGGYGQIGVYRVEIQPKTYFSEDNIHDTYILFPQNKYFSKLIFTRKEEKEETIFPYFSSWN